MPRTRYLFLLALAVPLAAQLAASAEGPQMVQESELDAFDPYRELGAWMKGDEEPAKDKNAPKYAGEQAKLDLAAKWYILYNTVTTKQKTPGALAARRDNLRSLIDDRITYRLYVNKNKVFRDRFAQAAVDQFKALFAAHTIEDSRLAHVNAALMLPIFARLGSPEFTDYLGELAKDAKHDVTRLFAFEALQDAYRASPPAIIAADENSTRKREAGRIDSLIDYVLKAPKGMKDNPPEVQDGYRFVRAEAIRALAETRIPAIYLLGQGQVTGFGGDLIAPVTYALLRVVVPGQEPLEVPPSLTEKVEAAIGLCNINAKDDKRYNPDLAVYGVAKTLQEFVTAYKQDYGTFTNAANKVRIPPRLPWKDLATRFDAALKAFPGNLPADSPARKAADKLAQEARTALGQMQSYALIVETTVLDQTISAIAPPQSDAVYSGKGSDAYKIQVK